MGVWFMLHVFGHKSKYRVNRSFNPKAAIILSHRQQAREPVPKLTIYPVVLFRNFTLSARCEHRGDTSEPAAKSIKTYMLSYTVIKSQRSPKSLEFIS